MGIGQCLVPCGTSRPWLPSAPCAQVHLILARVNDQSESDTAPAAAPELAGLPRCRALSCAACENFLYGFKAARRAARAAATARTPPLPLALPLRRRQRRRLARKTEVPSDRRPPRGSKGRGGFDKGTLAMAQIGLTGAGQKPARSPSQRTGHRPLSNPPLRLLEVNPP